MSNRWDLAVKTTGTVVILIALLASLSPGFASALHDFWIPKGKNWLDLFSTLGTCAAAIAAVWIAVDSRKRDDHRQMQLAHLVASEISTRLQRLLAKVVQLLTTMEESDEEHWREDLRAVKADLGKSEYQLFKRETLEGLIPLPRQAAHRLARAMDNLRLLRNRLEDRSNVIDKGSATFVRRFHESVIIALNNARADLQVADEECRRATALAAPELVPDVNEEAQ